MMISVLLLVTYSKQIKIKHILKFILTFFNIIKQSIKIELVWIPKGFPKAVKFLASRTPSCGHTLGAWRYKRLARPRPRYKQGRLYSRPRLPASRRAGNEDVTRNAIACLQ